ncbi:uncharacterized protein LOC127472742 [Manacus candei]|uniref:uncharacterized protein LOC127472742 n=1 Tax=Manacus candei TaxID=415023 RepID=UPI0022269361|nr:uncharacterized protein LOC127472742 [Manacus candei]
MQFFALYWGLASAYRAAVDYTRRTKVEAETQTLPPEIPLAPVVKRKSWVPAPDTLSLQPDGEQNRSGDDGEGTDTDASARTPPPRAATPRKMETTELRSMTPSELRDLQKDYTRRPGERILSWLLRCRDRGARGHMLSTAEAEQLASISGDHELDRLFAEEKPDLSLWARLVLSVRQRFPFKDYLPCPVRKWTKLEDAIQYLRELALLELMYEDPHYDPVTDDPEVAICTMPMWKKIIQGAPASYVHTLTGVMLPNMPETPVSMLCTVLRHMKETIESRNEFSRDYSDPSYRQRPERDEPYGRFDYEDDYGDHRDRRYRNRSADRSRPRSRSWSRSRSRSPSVTRRRSENPKRRSKRNELWSYLRAHGENMSKWDGEPTSRLEARVKELKRKEADKKVVYVVDADFFEKELRSPRRRGSGVRFQDDRKASAKPKQRSDIEGPCLLPGEGEGPRR